jgi:hypothetical protein
MIGSQSLKGIHFLHESQLQTSSIGVWKAPSGPDEIMAIETYPTPCKRSPTLERSFLALEDSADFRSSLQESNECHNQDLKDALCCALYRSALLMA